MIVFQGSFFPSLFHNVITNHLQIPEHLYITVLSACAATCRNVRWSHHGTEPANWHPHPVRARQEPEALEADAVPGRRGDRTQSHGGRGCSGKSQEVKWLRSRLCVWECSLSLKADLRIAFFLNPYLFWILIHDEYTVDCCQRQPPSTFIIWR